MKKRTRSTLFSILIISVLIIGSLFAFGIVGQTAFSTALSIDKVNIENQGELIRIFMVGTGAEELIIDFTPSEINAKLDDNYEATKSVTGRIEIQENIRSFPTLVRFDKAFYKFKATQIGILQKCTNNVPYGYSFLAYGGTTLTKNNCIYYRTIGYTNEFTSSYFDKTKIYANIGGNTGTLTPGDGSNTLRLSDGTTIEWTGNLVNTYGINTPPYDVFIESSTPIKLVANNAYEQSTNAIRDFTDRSSSTTLSNILGTSLGTIFSSFSVIENSVATYNNKIDSILSDRTSTYENSINAEDVRFVGNNLYVDLKIPTVFPTFIITMDADKVGIRYLTGEPSITQCASTQSFNSGEIINPTLKVKNIGASDGFFDGYGTCSDSNVNMNLGSEGVRGGETINFPIQLTGIAPEEDIATTCKITIEDRKSGDKDTCSFNANVKHIDNVVCDPGEVYCFGANILRTCNSDGSAYTDQTCQNGCQVIDNKDDECSGEPTDCISVLNSCNQKADNQPWLGWTYREQTKTPSTFLKIITFGTAKTKSECYCKATFLIYYIIGGIVLFLGTIGILYYGRKKKGGKRRKRK